MVGQRLEAVNHLQDFVSRRKRGECCQLDLLCALASARTQFLAAFSL